MSDRENRYAELIGRLYLQTSGGGVHSIEDIARAVMAVADEERAADRAEVFADVAALMNDRAAMWWASDHPGRGPKASECQNLANAFRTYAEGVGVPSMDTLRRKRREAEARLDALVADLRGLADEPDDTQQWPAELDALGFEETRRVAVLDVARLRAVLDAHVGGK